MGYLDDTFLQQLVPFLKDVKTLNLFDQKLLYERTLIKCLSRNLESICLNGCMVGVPLLTHILHTRTNLRYLSLVEATKMGSEEMRWFVDELKQNQRSIKIYSSFDVQGVRNQDEWFLEMGLDIFKMWDATCCLSL
jgi:hypothetical protein